LNVTKTKLDGVLIIEPKVWGDDRGFFMETWHIDRYEEIGLPRGFSQDNLSKSTGGVLRGLHFQTKNTQGKLVNVLEGEVFDVAVDIRVGSPTFGEWVGVSLSGSNKKQFYIPEGFAHGFCVTTPSALFCYKCTDIYNAKAEVALKWNDPDIGINWPVETPQLSEKDSNGYLLKECPTDLLPKI